MILARPGKEKGHICFDALKCPWGRQPREMGGVPEFESQAQILVPDLISVRP